MYGGGRGEEGSWNYRCYNGIMKAADPQNGEEFGEAPGKGWVVHRNVN